MAIARSKLTAQGQILEREEDGNQIVVRRGGRFTSEDIHTILIWRAYTWTTKPR